VIRKIAQYLVQPFCDQPDKEWLQADMLQEGDLVFSGPELSPVRIVRLEEQEMDEVVYDLQIEGAHSFVTEGCAVHNCSGYPYLLTQCR
jgi:hypothetical protein